MQKIGFYWLLAVVLVVMAQVGAWSAVSISWVDGGQSTTTTVPLQFITNPQWDPSDEDTQEPEFVWNGVLNVNMVSFSAMTFTGTGNYIGALGLSWNTVRLQQNVTNNTDKPWSDFHLGLGPTGNRFYKVWQLPENWSPTQGIYTCDFESNYREPVDPGARIERGQVFVDGIYLKAKTNTAGNGTFSLTKYPTYVPEAGTAAVFLSGGLGLLSYRMRRRKS